MMRFGLGAGIGLALLHAEHHDEALVGAVLRGESIERPVDDLGGLLVGGDDHDVTHVGRREAEGADLVLAHGPVALLRTAWILRWPMSANTVVTHMRTMK